MIPFSTGEHYQIIPYLSYYVQLHLWIFSRNVYEWIILLFFFQFLIIVVLFYFLIILKSNLLFAYQMCSTAFIFKNSMQIYFFLTLIHCKLLIFLPVKHILNHWNWTNTSSILYTFRNFINLIAWIRNLEWLWTWIWSKCRQVQIHKSFTCGVRCRLSRTQNVKH